MTGKSDTQQSLFRPRAAHARQDGLFDATLMGADACEALSAFQLDAYVELPDAVNDIILSCLQGAKIAKAFVFGLLNLTTISMPRVSFYLTTGYRCPIRLEGVGAQSKCLEYSDPQVTPLPDNKRSVALQILCFRNLW